MTDPSAATPPPLDSAERVMPVAEHAFAPLLRVLEHAASIDRRSAAIDRLAQPLGSSALAPMLRGRPLGHALHPLLTDLPLGCWTSAMLLDAVGGRSARPAARRLTALGLLGVAPAALSGLAEFDALERRPDRRVATTHAVANAIATGCQLLSWRARRRDRQLRGVWWGLMGNSVAAASGYLGGHLAFASGVGVDDDRSSTAQDR
jgi:uncharacterized membrane protein